MAATAGAQAPIWVPILVAALGIVGVLVSQVVAGIRATGERKAADRREDIRWTRSQDERLELMGREDRFRLHSDRTEAYANLTLATARWRDRLLKAKTERARSSESRISMASYESLGESQNAADQAGATVSLLAPDALRLSWLRAHASFLAAASLLLADDSTAAEIDEAVAQTRGKVEEMLAQMRDDLDVKPVADK